MLPPAHWGYMASGVDNDETLQANLQGFLALPGSCPPARGCQPHRHVHQIFGTTWETPIVLCPIGSARSPNPAGELAVGKAAQAKKTLQIVSTQASYPIEDITARAGGPVWFQLYTTNNFDATRRC